MNEAVIWVRVQFTKLIFLILRCSLALPRIRQHIPVQCTTLHARQFSALPLLFYDYYRNVNKWFRFVWFPAKRSPFSVFCFKTKIMCNFEPEKIPSNSVCKCHQFDHYRSAELCTFRIFFSRGANSFSLCLSFIFMVFDNSSPIRHIRKCAGPTCHILCHDLDVVAFDCRLSLSCLLTRLAHYHLLFIAVIWFWHFCIHQKGFSRCLLVTWSQDN